MKPFLFALAAGALTAVLAQGAAADPLDALILDGQGFDQGAGEQRVVLDQQQFEWHGKLLQVKETEYPGARLCAFIGYAGARGIHFPSPFFVR